MYSEKRSLRLQCQKNLNINGKNKFWNAIEGADKQYRLDPKENMVNVYYSMDEIGEIDPDEPDQHSR